MSVAFLLILGLSGLAVLALVVAVSIALTSKDAARQAWFSLALVIPIALLVGFTLFGFMLTGQMVRPTRTVKYESTRSIEFPENTTPIPRVEQDIRPDIPKTKGDVAPEEADRSVDEPAADPRPAWVDGPPTQTVGGVYQMVFSVGPYLSRADCDKMLGGFLSDHVQHYAETKMGGKAVMAPVSLPDDVLEELVVERWEETVQTSFGPMVQLQVLAQIDADLQRRIKQDVEAAYRRDMVAERVWWAGGAMSAVVAMLTILFVGLKVTRYGDGKQASSTIDAEGEV